MQPFVIAALLGIALAQNPGDAQACAKKCTDAMNVCRGQPGANQSTCQSDYANCLGYNPGEGMTATACINNNAQPTVSHPAGQTDECAKKCIEAYNVCRGQPGANQSTCRSDFAGCLGYNPPNDMPISCKNPMSMASESSSRPLASPTGPVVSDECVKKCNAAMDSCRTQPNANQAYCSSEYAKCLGYNPYDRGTYVTPTACSTSGVPPTKTAAVVAGGSQLHPASAVMALGILALL